MNLATVLVAAATATSVAASDPFLWLEDVEGERAIAWVRAQNDRSLGELTKDPRYQRFYAAALAIAEDKSRIPSGTPRAGWVYNFWQDDQNVRGLWRRTSIESYRKAAPDWQVLLDVDALAKSEDRNWVFKGVTCLPPAGRRCLVELSDGGKDAAVQREFDVEARAFVANGFALPEAKSRAIWKNEDTLVVATDWGPDTLTTSGYPFVVKEWRRGQPLEAAKEIYRGQQTDVGVSPGSFESESGARLLLLYEYDTFFTTTIWSLDGSDRPVRATLPAKATPRGYHRGELVFTIEEDWNVGGRTWKSGSLLSMPAAQLAHPAPSVRLVVEPGARESIEDVEPTGAGVLVASYSNVRGRVLRFTFDGTRWTRDQLPLPGTGAVALENTDSADGTAYVTYEDFLQPDTLYEVDVRGSRASAIKNLPAKFDGSRHVTEQFETTSRDGTRVPYFVVRPKSFTANGTAPTLLYAYGGFQISMTPSYSATLGQLWLEQGGVFVLANIRGGGEFGPAWHQAGLKTKRQVVYDDFIAVAEDLVRRKITSSRRLGIQGGSNGGLLMGVALTQRPELFHAAVVQVPLLDMLRYHQLLAGASWVDEYGSPDVPEERAWLEKLSPYHHLAKRADFPLPLFVTSTKDDRVHPGHARKFAARMEALGMPYLYYENIDGGHSAAANQRERAKRQALEFTYLARRLID
ncbi:MAG: prolyl oligopeptidase family serine peptidase [Steroidobacteraceae bacterium]